MTLNGEMAITLRYFTEFGKAAFRHITASICGGIYARVLVFCSACTRKFTFAISSPGEFLVSDVVVNPFVCLLSSVCNVREPYSTGWNFRQCFFAICIPLPSVDIKVYNFTEKVSAKAISRKRCKIVSRLVLITNRKSHDELSIGTKLGDLEWPWTSLYCITLHLTITTEIMLLMQSIGRCLILNKCMYVMYPVRKYARAAWRGPSYGCKGRHCGPTISADNVGRHFGMWGQQWRAVWRGCRHATDMSAHNVRRFWPYFL